MAPGTAINVKVSSGKVTVPDVKGKTQNEAFTLLNEAGLTPRSSYKQTADVPEGTVMEQDKGAGGAGRRRHADHDHGRPGHAALAEPDAVDAVAEHLTEPVGVAFAVSLGPELTGSPSNCPARRRPDGSCPSLSS